MKNAILFLIIGMAVLVGCRRDPLPKGAIKKKVFIDVLVDVNLAEGIVEDKAMLKLDSISSKSLYLSILKKHKVTEEQMVKTALYYTRNQKEYDKVYTEVITKINELSEAENTPKEPNERIVKELK